MSSDWLLLLFIVFITLCFGAGAYSIARAPSFYIGLAKELSPLIKGLSIRFATEVVKRNPPDVEKRMNEVIRRGGEWDNFNKRERRK